MGEAQTPAVSADADEQLNKDNGNFIPGDGPNTQDGNEPIDKEAQAGVQKVEALASVWSRKTLLLTYGLIWFVYFIMLLQQVSSSALIPYVTSAFALHSLTATVGTLAAVIGGVCNLTVAKILDVFGRPQGYLIALIIATLGLIMMAATQSVELYAAAQVFWTVGNAALGYSINIFVADTSSLRSRGLMTALTTSPNIITIWLGGPISEAFYLRGPGWAWCFGAFSIILPVLCLPLFVVMLVQTNKAKSQGILVIEKSGRNPLQSVLYYLREFDAVGLLLLTAGISLFLLPFNIWSLQPDGFKTPMIICFIVFGLVLMILFAIWEKFLAPVTFIPYSLLLDRNMIGSCILCLVLGISYSTWNSFFSSFLQVVNNLTITEASYVTQIYGCGSSIACIATGYYIHYTGRYKYVTLAVAIPIYTLFMGLMIYFRSADQGIGYIVMCQIFLAFSSGVLIISPQIAAVSSASHQHVAVVMAIISMFTSIGSAIGLTVATLIWNQTFPIKLLEYLPLEDQESYLDIYSSLVVQTGYPVGSPTRIAIQHAYSDAQKMMCIAGTALWVAGAASVAIWRNTDVRTIKQVKGQVI
ncbi:unnamed protein product [Clonostachys rosea f. rosea IK726]|uniref:Major facilitator superfamily (MFS) profile domain-containing protein n=2 Tax=Bionectria ochroleuca TaxID=29856 RepID=A0A0B7K6P2_BIOOC|nr:unnamed protein product [Clonostachys rosea f. rosea IK726]